MDLNAVPSVAVWALPVLLAVILHEVAHGWVAYRLGDPTARDAGRLTLNPLPHIDPVGTILIPVMLLLTHAPFLFGYARPVPVNFRRLRSPKRDMVLVAGAGPATNLLLAAISALLLQVVVPDGPTTVVRGLLVQSILNSVLMNVGLAVFNMLPVPPLDGGRVLTGLLPMPLAVAFARLERYGMLIVVLLLATDVSRVVLRPVMRFLLNLLL